MTFNLKKIKKENADEEMLCIICCNLMTIYDDGLKINEAIKILSDAVTSRAYKESFNGILNSLDNGKTLSESFRQYDNLYPELFISMVHIGEESGRLSDVFKSLYLCYKSLYIIKKKIKKALTYPLFVFVCLLAVVLFMFKYIIPNILDIYNSMDIHKDSAIQMLFQISSFINKSFISFLAYIIIYLFIIPCLIFKLFSKSISIDKFRFLPIIKDYMEYRIILILYIIISSKINISKGLRLCRNSMDSENLNKIMASLDDEINKGSTLSSALEKTEVLSNYSLSIIKIRENTGSIEGGLSHLVLKIQNAISEKLQKYLSYIQPAFIIFMSFLISLFIFSVVMPIFNGLTGITA